MKITEKKSKSPTRAVNETDVVEIKVEPKKETTIDKIVADMDKVMLFNNKKYLTKDEVVAILNSYIKD